MYKQKLLKELQKLNAQDTEKDIREFGYATARSFSAILKRNREYFPKIFPDFKFTENVMSFIHHHITIKTINHLEFLLIEDIKNALTDGDIDLADNQDFKALKEIREFYKYIRQYTTDEEDWE